MNAPHRPTIKGRSSIDTQATSVAEIAGDAEIDHAVATLVLAFNTDPVARWMYGDPYDYLRHSPRLFHALGASSFKARAAQRTTDGHGVALWLPPGVDGDEKPLLTVLAQTINGDRSAEVDAVFERTERYRPNEPHWYLSLIGVEVRHRNKGCGSGLLKHGLCRCDRERLPAYLWSSNPLNTSLYQRNGFEIVGSIQVGSSPPIFPMLRPAR